MNERPYIICHMLISPDGRTDGAFLKHPLSEKTRNYSDGIRLSYGCDAVISGSVSVAGTYASGYLEETPRTDMSFPRENRILPSDTGKYYIVIDLEGKVKYDRDYFENSKLPRSKVLSVLGEDVSDGYIAYLREMDIAYIFAGKKVLDTAKLLSLLKNDLGVERLLLTGGGTMNWTFLKAGSIDEINVVVLPVTDGGEKKTSLFERSAYCTDEGCVGFSIGNIQTCPGDGIWIKYIPVYER